MKAIDKLILRGFHGKASEVNDGAAIRLVRRAEGLPKGHPFRVKMASVLRERFPCIRRYLYRKIPIPGTHQMAARKIYRTTATEVHVVDCQHCGAELIVRRSLKTGMKVRCSDCSAYNQVTQIVATPSFSPEDSVKNEKLGILVGMSIG